MNVKTFRAKSMQEALALVRSEFGPQASVLRARELRPRGLSRFWNADGLIEVVASDQVSVPSRLPGQQPMMRPVTVPAAHAGLDLSDAPVDVAIKYAKPNGGAFTGDGADRRAGAFFTELHIDWQLGGELLRAMQEIAPELPADAEAMRAQLAVVIERHLSVCGPIRCTPGQRRIVALVGPTGVGKTTTVAKLAAHFQLEQRRRVGVLTLDTYRVGAVQQLCEYAGILEIPFEVANTAGDICAALQRLSAVELLLIDTAGCSPRDLARLRHLQLQLSDVNPHEVHLVLSAAASSQSLVHTLDQFRPLGCTSVIVSKVDEPEHLGALVALGGRGKLPISYLTSGQEVPADLHGVRARPLARAIAGYPLVLASAASVAQEY